MARVELRDIVTDADRAAAIALRWRPGQDRFVESVEESFRDAIVDARAAPAHVDGPRRGRDDGRVRDDQRRDRASMEADLIGPYYLWRLLIDRRFQRRGYGTAALDAIVAYVRTRPGAAILWVSAGQGEGSPQPFYERYGFVRDGPDRRGRGRPATGPAAGGVMKALDPDHPRRRPDRSSASRRT